MADEIPEMHEDFPQWHAAVTVGIDAEHKAARWAAVSSLANAADRPLIEALVRLAFATRQSPASDNLAKIQEAFRTADDTFDPKKAAREMQVYAGACLQLLFESDSDYAAIAALSVVTAAFVGARSPDLPVDIVAVAEAALVRIADASRVRPLLAMHGDLPKIDITAAVNKVRTEQNGESFAQGLEAVVTSFRGALRSLNSKQVGAFAGVSRFIQVQDEELQMLWWLTGGYSEELGTAFDQVPAETRPLLFATELAESTTSLPGPRSIKAILTRAGLSAESSVTTSSAINSMEREWLEGLVDENPSPVTSPMHFAVARQIEAGGGETWLPNWSAVTEIEGAREIPSIALALQFYRERLLARFE